MIRLLTAVPLFASFNAAADELKTFSDGQVIEADDFNHNFQKLEQDIADIPEGPPGTPGPAGADGVVNGVTCTTDQIVRYDGNAWICVDDPLAGLNCDVGDQLRMGSGGWECRAEPITASLVQDNWDYQGGVLAPITTYFDSISNVETSETSSYCDLNLCFIKVIGITDHSSCVVQVTGDAVSGAGVYIDSLPPHNEILIGDVITWNGGQEVYINISCTP